MTDEKLKHLEKVAKFYAEIFEERILQATARSPVYKEYEEYEKYLNILGKRATDEDIAELRKLKRKLNQQKRLERMCCSLQRRRDTATENMHTYRLALMKRYIDYVRHTCIYEYSTHMHIGLRAYGYCGYMPNVHDWSNAQKLKKAMPYDAVSDVYADEIVYKSTCKQKDTPCKPNPLTLRPEGKPVKPKIGLLGLLPYHLVMLLRKE